MAALPDKIQYPANEAQRLEALRQTHILDTLPGSAYEDLARLAAQVCGVPISGVSLVDAERQWFKAIIGMDLHETPRGDAFCSHTILQPEMMIVPDTSLDERFSRNPLVTSGPQIRFYAGVPLTTPEGFALGSLCVIDRAPRVLTEAQKTALQILARQTVAQIELTRRVAEEAEKVAQWEAVQREVSRSEARLAEAQQVAQIGSWEYDVDAGKITWSAEMFRLLGFDPAHGEPDHATMMEHYHPDDCAMHNASIMQALNDGLPYEFDIRILPAERVMHWSHVRGQAARNESGRIVRLFGTAMDITKRRLTEEENARLAAIIESSQDAVLGLTLDGTLVSWNAGAERLYGYRESEIIGQSASLLAPPEQRGHIAAVIRALQRGETQKNWDLHFRRMDGTASDTVLTFSPIRSPRGEVIGAAAIGRDVTEQRQAEEAVRRSEARLTEAQRVAKIGSWEYDLVSGAITWSREMYRLVGRDEALGEPDYGPHLALYHPEDAALLAALVSRAVSHGEDYETDLRLADRGEDGRGPTKWLHAIGSVARGADSQVVRLSGTLADITDRKRAEQQIRDYSVVLELQKEELEQANSLLQDLATTDGLTGLKNHRAFQERLRSDIESARRHGTPLSLILLDVDHFKQYNDQFGHPAGDAVLKQVAQVLGQTTRDCDFVARYGGEEFIIILPQADPDGAVRAAERCRLALEVAEWSFRPVTASFGTATLSLGSTSGPDLIAAADQALYAAKFNGRNQVVQANSFCLACS